MLALLSCALRKRLLCDANAIYYSYFTSAICGKLHSAFSVFVDLLFPHSFYSQPLFWTPWHSHCIVDASNIYSLHEVLNFCHFCSFENISKKVTFKNWSEVTIAEAELFAAKVSLCSAIIIYIHTFYSNTTVYSSAYKEAPLSLESKGRHSARA